MEAKQKFPHLCLGRERVSANSRQVSQPVSNYPDCPMTGRVRERFVVEIDREQVRSAFFAARFSTELVRRAVSFHGLFSPMRLRRGAISLEYFVPPRLGNFFHGVVILRDAYAGIGTRGMIPVGNRKTPSPRDCVSRSPGLRESPPVDGGR